MQIAANCCFYLLFSTMLGGETYLCLFGLSGVRKCLRDACKSFSRHCCHGEPYCNRPFTQFQ